MDFRLRVLSLFYGDENIFAFADPVAADAARGGDWLAPFCLNEIVAKLRLQREPLPRHRGARDLVKYFLCGGVPESESASPALPHAPRDTAALAEFGALFHLAHANYHVSEDGRLHWCGTWNDRRLIRDVFPMELLHAVRVSQEQMPGLPRKPVETVNGDDPAFQIALEGGLSDNHIHMAAAIPFWELLSLALRALRFPSSCRDAFGLGENGRIADRRPQKSQSESSTGSASDVRKLWLGHGSEALQERMAAARMQDVLLTLKALMIALHDFRENSEQHATFRDFLQLRLKVESTGMKSDCQSDKHFLVRRASLLWCALFPSPITNHNENALWREFRNFALTPPQDTSKGESPAALRLLLAGQSPFPATDSPSLSNEVHANFLRLHTHPRDDDFSFYWLQAVRLMCWLYRTTRHGKGFYEFETAFPAVDCLLEAAGLQNSRPPRSGLFPSQQNTDAMPDPLTERTLLALSQTVGLRRVELRFPVRMPQRRVTDRSRGHRVSTESLRRELNEYNAAAARVPSIAARFAIHLLRKVDERRPELQPKSLRSRQFKPGFRDIWKRGEYIATLLTEYPVQSAAIPIHPVLDSWPCPIDVASNEDTLPNWVFAAVFAEIRDRVFRSGRVISRPLSFQAHAGEHFHTPLHGLRRLWETLEFMKPLQRIGHALALDAPEIWPQELYRREYFDDIVWATTLLTEHGLYPELAASLESKSLDLAPKIVGEHSYPLTRNLLWQAYRARFSREDLSRVGLLRKNTASGFYEYIGEVFPLQKMADLKHQLLANTLGTWGKNDMVRISVEMQEKLKQAYVALRPSLFMMIRDEKIIIECCPSSNLAIADYEKYEDHPAFELMRQNCLFTLNSDDPAIFQTTIIEELASLWRAAHDHEELHRMDRRMEWMRNLLVLAKSIHLLH